MVRCWVNFNITMLSKFCALRPSFIENDWADNVPLFTGFTLNLLFQQSAEMSLLVYEYCHVWFVLLFLFFNSFWYYTWRRSVEKMFEIEWKIDEMFTQNLQNQFSKNPLKNRRAFKETKQVKCLKGKINLFSREWCFKFLEPQSIPKR